MADLATCEIFKNSLSFQRERGPEMGLFLFRKIDRAGKCPYNRHLDIFIEKEKEYG